MATRTTETTAEEGGATIGVLSIADDANAWSDRDEVHEPGLDDLPKIVVDADLCDEGAITDRQIQILLAEATSGQDGRATRMCIAALESANPTIRRIARGGCAELWANRIVDLDSRRIEPMPIAYPRYDEDLDEDDEPAVGNVTAVIALLAQTPVQAREASEGRIEAQDAPPPSTAMPIPQLYEFPCPMCHRPIFGEDDGQALRVPPHRIREPVFPFGYKHPPHTIQCPASGMELTQLCDSEHELPGCGDPQCWQLPNEQPVSFAEDPEEPVAPVESFLPRPDEWRRADRTANDVARSSERQRAPQGTPPRR